MEESLYRDIINSYLMSDENCCYVAYIVTNNVNGITIWGIWKSQ